MINKGMDDIKERHVGDVRQFKLASGDEIICEVIEWNDPYLSLIHI